MLQVARGWVEGGSLVLNGLLATLCVGTLWFRRLQKSRTLLDHHVPPTPLGWSWVALSTGVFFAGSLLAYHLPLVSLLNINQFSFMTLGFAAAGIGWLPLIAMVLSIEALDRQTRTGKL